MAGILTDRRLIGLRSDVGAFDGESSAGMERRSAATPNYRLRACFDENPELQHGAKRVTLWGSLKSTRLALWDEKTQKLVSFRQAARAPATA